MSISAWHRSQSRPLEAADYSEIRDRLVSSARWYGNIFGATAVLQVVSGVMATAQSDPIVRFGVPALTAVFAGVWLCLWYTTAMEYRRLRATFINADFSPQVKGNSDPFWVDTSRVWLVLCFYLQVVVVSWLLCRTSAESAVALLAQLGPTLTWPAAVVAVVFCLREVLRPTALPARAGDKVQDRVRTLEVRADNARLPEPDADQEPSRPVDSEDFKVLVENAPTAAVVLAWREVERALRQYTFEAKLPSDHAHPRRLIQIVSTHASNPAAISSLIGELYKLRNETLHTDCDITSYAAEEYLRLSRRVIAWLRRAFQPSEEAMNGHAEAGGDNRQFTVMLQGLADSKNKIPVIKVIREITGFALADIKTLVESAPRPVRTNLTLQEATIWRQKLEAAGAQVQVDEVMALSSPAPE